MKKVALEYIFNTPKSFLMKRFNTPSGLNEWFAEDISVDGDIYLFKWGDYENKARKKTNYKNKVRFDWLDDDGKYTEFRFEYNKLTGNTTVFITDVYDDDESEDEIKLYWDNLIKQLKRKLGLSV